MQTLGYGKARACSLPCLTMTLQAHVWNLNVHPLPYPKGYEISPRKSQSVLEIIEPEDEVVDSIHSGKCACTVNPPRPATPSAGDLNPERENHLDSAEAYRQHIFRSSATGTSDLVVRVPG